MKVFSWQEGSGKQQVYHGIPTPVNKCVLRRNYSDELKSDEFDGVNYADIKRNDSVKMYTNFERFFQVLQQCLKKRC